MTTIIHSAVLSGVRARAVIIEATTTPGLPLFAIIGLGDAATHESRYRVTVALRNAGYELPVSRITVTVTPSVMGTADAASLDLPIALAVAAEAGLVASAAELRAKLAATAAFGELLLSGRVKSVRGALARVEATNLAGRILLVPAESWAESQIGSPIADPVASLVEAIGYLTGTKAIMHQGVARFEDMPYERPTSSLRSGDFSQVRVPAGLGEALAEAIVAAVAARKPVVLVGPPGSGKTMIARRLVDLLPPMTEAETLDVVRHFSAAGLGTPLAARPGRPFRAPHHTVSEAGLVGATTTRTPRRPGEVTLATHGVLFLDEVADLPKRVIAGLFAVVRVGNWHDMPAAPALIVGACEVADLPRVAMYFPTVIEMPALAARDLLEGEALPSTAELRARVAARSTAVA